MYSINIHDHYKLLKWGGYLIKQTGSKHSLSTYRVLGFGQYTQTRQWKRRGPCPHGAHSLLKLTNDHKHDSKAPGRHYEEGTGSAWRTQGRLHRDGDNGAEPWMRRSPRWGEGEAHSKQRKQHMSKRNLESTCHGAGWCSPAQLERKGAHKLKRWIRFRFLVKS